jgi:hypothetical protein
VVLVKLDQTAFEFCRWLAGKRDLARVLLEALFSAKSHLVQL